MKILMIAYYFPPDASSGSFRPFYFAKHFNEKKEQVFILTAMENDFLQEQPKDYKLLEQVINIEIFRTKVFRPREIVLNLRDKLISKHVKPFNQTKSNSEPSITAQKNILQGIKDFITSSLSSPDPHIGWLPSAVYKGLDIIKSKKIDIIYATGSPWTCLLIGACLKIITKKTLVLDFRDPWTANPGFMVRSRFFRFVESFMERFAVSHSDLIVANTIELGKNFIERYKLSPQKVCTITNGFESYFPPKPSVDGKFTLTHAGSLYFSRTPKYLLQAVQQLTEQCILTKANFVINFIGGISIDDSELNQLLAHKKIQGLIRIIPRLPFDEVCEYQSRSDVLFLIQTDFPLQVPRKLYEYMAFRKPVLAITNKIGATGAIIKEEGIGIVVENRVEDITNALLKFFSYWERNDLDTNYTHTCDHYSNKILCEKLRQQLIRLNNTKH